MSSATHPFASPADFIRALVQHPRRVLLPAVVIAGLVGVYAAVKPDVWEATQPFVLRNEAAGNQESLGKFRYPEELKTKQETVLELGKSNGVLAGALAKVGPPAGDHDPAAWPTPQDVVDLRRSVKVTPPKGVELGATEMFYIKVKAEDRNRAEQLSAAVAEQLQVALQRLRSDRAQSMIDELAKAVAVNESDLDTATASMAELEKSVGEDLSELRNLQELPSGDSDIRRRTVEIENELRRAQNEERNDRELLKLLTAAQQDPEKLLATPNRLLDSQPALRRLKEGLVDAQLKSADLVGRLAEEHPMARAARNSEIEIRHNLHDEIASATQGVEANLQLTSTHVAALQERLAGEKLRLERIATVRGKYANLSAAVKHRTLLLEASQRDLAAARGAKAAAQISSVITPIDTPDAGVQPTGPSRAMLIAAGVVGGLICGLGVLFLTLQPVSPASSASYAYPEDRESNARRRQEAGRQRDRDRERPLAPMPQEEEPEPVGSVHD
jgi:polysaccharide biosynthesis transport protein